MLAAFSSFTTSVAHFSTSSSDILPPDSAVLGDGGRGSSCGRAKYDLRGVAGILEYCGGRRKLVKEPILRKGVNVPWENSELSLPDDLSSTDGRSVQQITIPDSSTRLDTS